MRHATRTLTFLAIVISACGGEAPPAARLPSPPVPAPTASATASATAPALVVASDPTELTDAQKQRDAARAPLAASIVDAYPNVSSFFSSLVANWSHDGKHALFGSTRDGVPEIYEGDVAHPGDAPRAVTAGPERAIWARYTPDGKSILFLRDSSGDENHHIWRVGVDGTGLVDRTPGDLLQREEPFIPRKKPGTMLYSATRTTSAEAMLFVQSVAGGDAKLVYTNPRWGGLADATADGARVLFSDVPARSETVLLEIDLAAGQPRRVYPADGKKVSMHGMGYSSDGRRIYVSTDEGTESSVLLALDAKTGTELARYVNDAPATAPINFGVSPTGDRIALGIDCGDHGEVRILDARTLKLQRTVKVPLGDVQLGDYRDDGKGFSILISLPDKPADPYWVDAATGDVHPLRQDKRPGLESLPPIDVGIEHVKAFDGLTIPVNRYLPKVEAGKKLPTIVIFHGGPATSSHVRWNAYARFFVALGYAVLEPNVRGSSGFGRAYEMADNREKRADWLKDLESVNAWTKAQPWCDPDRVVVWGQSYGGYTTLMALTRQPSLWRAGVDLYGIADLKAFLRTTHAAIRSVFVNEFGDVEKDGPLLDQFSPMRDVDKIVAPLFVYAGQNDVRVPRSESDTIVMAMRKRGVPVEYMVAANEGHSVDRRESKIELLTRTARFLEDALSAKAR
jgi:dipeptidyl aminopeptidase/acylaminoacyl peptidase